MFLHREAPLICSRVASTSSPLGLCQTPSMSLSCVVSLRQDQRRTFSSTISPALGLAFFDTHCHIGLGGLREAEGLRPTDPSYPFVSDASRRRTEEEFVRALDAGVRRMTLVGIDYASTLRFLGISAHLNGILTREQEQQSQQIQQQKQQQQQQQTSQQLSPHHLPPSQPSPTRPPMVCFSAGLHPHSAMRHATEFPKIAALAKNFVAKQTAAACAAASAATAPLPRLVAVGETGMDFFKSRSSEQEQRTSLEKHLQLAKDLGLPVIIHGRDCDEALFDVLRRFAPLAGVMHCFSSNRHWMEQYLSIGMHISFTNNITYPRAVALQQACAACPLDRMLIETDSPFLPPQHLRGKPNEPVNVISVFNQVLKLKGIPPLSTSPHSNSHHHRVSSSASTTFSPATATPAGKNNMIHASEQSTYSATVVANTLFSNANNFFNVSSL